MPSSIATWVSARPLDASSDTASRLNSSVKDRLAVVCVVINSPRPGQELIRGVHSFGGGSVLRRDTFLISNFRLIDRDTGFLMPSSVDDWLPQRHLARFVVELVDALDLRAMTGSYRLSGEAFDHPQLLVGLIINGYCATI